MTRCEILGSFSGPLIKLLGPASSPLQWQGIALLHACVAGAWASQLVYDSLCKWRFRFFCLCHENLSCVQKYIEVVRVTSHCFIVYFLCKNRCSIRFCGDWSYKKVIDGDKRVFRWTFPPQGSERPCIHFAGARWLVHLPNVTLKFMASLLLTSTF